jgi:crotonobetainyl-CoA:carnitine CoA-transferase CaiB-like acyl-CoA transferase
LAPPPPPRPYATSSEEELIQRLRDAPAADQRSQVVDEIVRRGDAARPLLVAALEEELVLADVIDEALRRLDGAPAPVAANDAAANTLSDPPWVEEKYRLALSTRSSPWSRGPCSRSGSSACGGGRWRS